MSTEQIDAARRTERAYQSPPIVQQRLRTLEALAPRPGDRVLDAGCGPGLLSVELARLVGPAGRVLGVDRSAAMLALARRRGADLAQIEWREAGIQALDTPAASFDALAATQLLLYVDDVAGLLAGFRRLLKPGGRIAVVETDWRSCVLGSEDQALSEVMIQAWDRAVASPNLPARMAPLLRRAGFSGIRIEPIPILETSLAPGCYSADILETFRSQAVAQGRVDAHRAATWLEALHDQAARDEYFFCVNRFLFSAVA